MSDSPASTCCRAGGQAGGHRAAPRRVGVAEGPRCCPAIAFQCWLWFWSCPLPACLFLAPSLCAAWESATQVPVSEAMCDSCPGSLGRGWALGGLSTHRHPLQQGDCKEGGATAAQLDWEGGTQLQTSRVGGPCWSCGQERPFPKNVLERNLDPASSPKSVTLSFPQGECWAPGMDLCV